MSITIGGKSFDASPREFSTGSLGWNVNDKLTIEINGKEVTVQIGMNLTSQSRTIVVRSRIIVIGRDGEIVKEAGSSLPNTVVERVNELSYEFMNYPDDVAMLGLKYYKPYVEGEGPERTSG